MSIGVKICGLKDQENLHAAIEGGASFVGFVFFSKSPRALTPEQAAPLIRFAGRSIKKVGLIVDAGDHEIVEILKHCRLDMLQLHGRESALRIRAVAARFGLPVMKALPVAAKADLAAVQEYGEVADWLLFDAKPQAQDSRPGGNARSFDWSILNGVSMQRPWMLAGGLHQGNVQEAIRISGTKYLDVSSGVEDAPGQKNPKKIGAFLKLVMGL